MDNCLKKITLDGVEYVRADTIPTPAKMAVGKRGPLVLVRSTGAGVHVGELVARDVAEVTLANARRLWSWDGANTLNEVSQNGVAKSSRISEPVPEIIITAYHEVIKVSEKAAESLTRSGWGK